MLVKGIFTNISGSTGGVTASRNKGGQYLRARTTPVNPNSTRQQLARSRFTNANNGWSTLTAAQRTLWNDFAALQAWVNALGDPIQLSGQQAYVGSYSALASATLTPVAVPPPPNTRPASLVIPVFAPAIAATNAGTFTPGTLSAADIYVIGVSPPLPPGITSYKGPYRIGEVSDGDSTSTDFSTNVYSAIVAAHGAPTIGQRFALRITAVLATGQYSNPAVRISGPTVA